jgi:hypothetical protein
MIKKKKVKIQTISTNSRKGVLAKEEVMANERQHLIGQ